MINPVKFIRKPLIVIAEQVTLENMSEMAEWCKGEIFNTNEGKPYIKVPTYRPMNASQTRAFEGDRLVFAEGKGFKVYNQRAFLATFDPFEEPEITIDRNEYRYNYEITVNSSERG